MTARILSLATVLAILAGAVPAAAGPEGFSSGSSAGTVGAGPKRRLPPNAGASPPSAEQNIPPGYYRPEPPRAPSPPPGYNRPLPPRIAYPPQTDRVSCDEAVEILRDEGFYSIRVYDCEGRYYSFRARYDGRRYVVTIRASDGEIVDVERS
jgi:hypothetical protein